MNETRPHHRALVHALRTRVLEGPGTTEPALRQQVAARAAGGSPAAMPYDVLARHIGEAARATTDEQVAAIVRAAGSEKAAFEIILAAAVGAGLVRWQRATAVLDEVSDAST
jgi:hypothetical protein